MEEITIETILKVFKSYSEGKRIKQIKQDVAAMLYPDVFILDTETSEVIDKSIDDVIKADKGHGNNSFLTYNKGIYKKRKNRRPPEAPDPMHKDYIGRAGECAVMSELMFRGYNANRMMIDEGVDIVAVKNNLYYYIQVKTTTINDSGRVYCTIGNDRFEQYIGAQIRYVIVARYKDHGIDRNMFFVFDSRLIQQAIYQQCVKKGENGVSIKIKFNERDGAPVLYDIKEMDVSWYKDRFEL